MAGLCRLTRVARLFPNFSRKWPIVRFLSLLISLTLLATEATAQPPVTALVVSPDGATVLSGSQAGVAILAWPELKQLGKLATAIDQVNDLAFSPDGKQLLISGGAPAESGTVEIWSWPETKLVLKAAPHGDLIYQAAWNASGDRIVTASADGTAQVLDGKTLESLLTYLGHSRAVLAACWGADGQALTAGVDQTIQIWEVADGRPIRTLSNHVGSVNQLGFRPAAGGASTVLASISEDRTVRLWQPKLPRLMRFAKLSSPPRAFVWLKSGDHLAVGCNDGIVRILDFDELKAVKELAGEVGRIHVLAAHPKEAKLIVGGERGVRAIDLPELPAKKRGAVVGN